MLVPHLPFSRRLLAAACLASLLLAPAAAAERTPWNQEEVTRLAVELSTTLGEFLADPGVEAKQATALQQRKHHSAIVSVRELDRRAVELVRQLRTGHGYEQTKPLWRQMHTVLEEIQWYAQESFLPPTARAKANAVLGLLEAIDPYYAEG